MTPRHLILLAALLPGCTVDVTLEGKACPCADGFVCDEELQRCAAAPTCTPRVAAMNLEAEWATSNTIRWTWTLDGNETDALEYELVVAETIDDLATRSGTARIYNRTTNPELGSPKTRSTGSDGLEPGRRHIARLNVTDIELCGGNSRLGATSTSPRRDSEIVLFRDEIPVGAELAPKEPVMELTADATGAHLSYSASDDVECVGGTALCYQPLRLRELNQSLVRNPEDAQAVGLDHDRFGNAFLEMKVSNESPVHSDYGNLWLRFGDCFDDAGKFNWDYWWLRSDGDYVTIQVPLAELSNQDGRPLSFADLSQALCGFAVISAWHETSKVRIDDVVIRY